MRKATVSILSSFCCALIVLASCKKDAASTNPTPAPVDTIPTTDSAQRLKRIIQSDPVTHTAFITSLEYDADNRLIKFNEWSEDSSVTPVQITDANYSSLVYEGSNGFPLKNIITEETGAIDSTLYYYDSQNRVIKEEYYGGGSLNVRNLYSYLSTNVVLLNKYIQAGTLQLSSVDSLIYDAGKILERRSYNSGNVYTGTATFGYDTKKNPLETVNAFQYLYTLFGDDQRYQDRAPDNLISFSRISTSSTYSYTLSLNYNSNSYPVNGSVTINGSSTPTQTYLLTYLYY